MLFCQPSWLCVCAHVSNIGMHFIGVRGREGGVLQVGWARRTHKCVTLKTPVTGCHLLEFNPPIFLLRMFCANVLLFPTLCDRYYFWPYGVHRGASLRQKVFASRIHSRRDEVKFSIAFFSLKLVQSSENYKKYISPLLQFR